MVRLQEIVEYAAGRAPTGSTKHKLSSIPSLRLREISTMDDVCYAFRILCVPLIY